MRKSRTHSAGTRSTQAPATQSGQAAGAIRNPCAASDKPRTGNARAARIAVRIAYALVFAVNVQCALSFVIWPSAFASQFELNGVAGYTAVQGLGVAFLMWNATYPAVIAKPQRFRSLAIVVLAQQAIGLTGESCIRLSLPSGHAALSASIDRFIAFDAAGFVLMAAAFAWLAIADRA